MSEPEDITPQLHGTSSSEVPTFMTHFLKHLGEKTM